MVNDLPIAAAPRAAAKAVLFQAINPHQIRRCREQQKRLAWTSPPPPPDRTPIATRTAAKAVLCKAVNRITEHGHNVFESGDVKAMGIL